MITSSASASAVERLWRKKSWISSTSPPVLGSRRGGSPRRIEWAAPTIIDRRACRKTCSSRTVGAISASISSQNGLPGPTGGSWSASPIRTRWVFAAIPAIRCRQISSESIEASSTITRSASIGESSSLPGISPGIHSSALWIVDAGAPSVASVSRRAARPVGASSRIFRSRVSAIRVRAWVRCVLPVPGRR